MVDRTIIYEESRDAVRVIAKCLGCGKPFHNSHGVGTSWARPARPDLQFGGSRARREELFFADQLPAECNQRCSVPISQKAKVADTDEAAGQHMQEKTAEELIGGKSLAGSRSR